FPIPSLISSLDYAKINATSLKVMENLDFDTMPSIVLDIMVIGIMIRTTFTWRKILGIVNPVISGL
ncbi:hypothetical protein RhiirA4_413111, partial [Rhizophagus irregularis]